MPNLFLIEEYVKDLEQDQMDVANASHASPNSAEEGVPNPYEHNPHLQKYRAESAVVNTVKNNPNVDWNLGAHFVHGAQRLPKRFVQGQAIEDAQDYANYKQYVDIINNSELEKQAFTIPGYERPANWDDISSEEQYAWESENYPRGVPTEIENLYRGRAQATAMQEAGDRRLDPETVINNLVGTTQELKEHQAKSPQYDVAGLENIMKSEGFLNSVQSFIDNPKAAMQLTAQSVGESSPLIVLSGLAAIATGGVGGAAAAAGGGYAINQLFGISQALEKYGVDPSNPQQIAMLMDQPEFLNKVLDDARTYGMAHAGIEGVVGFGMGKLLKLGGPTTNLAQSLTRRGAAIPLQAGGEMAGEFGALHAIDQGPDNFPGFGGEVALEGLGGGVSGGAMAIPPAAVDIVKAIRTPPIAPGGIPNLPALPQGPAQEVAPSATGEHIDMRRREFLRKARDMAQAAATVRPTDLLPDLAPEAAVSAPVQAGLPATLVRFDYANPPLWSAYNFDVSGWKDQYPGETTGFEHTIDVEFNPDNGIVTVYDASYSGAPDIGMEVVGEAHISELIPDYVESQEVSQIDVDKAIMAYVKDNFSTNSVGDELRPVFTNVERDFDNTGDDGGPMRYEEIENYDYMNRPYDRAFEILGTDGFGFRKEPISQSRPGPLIQNNIGQIQNLRDQNDPDRAPGTKIRQEFDKEQKILEERERRRQPIQNNVELVQELRDQEDNTNKRKREAMRAFDEKQQEIEEIARTKELTDKIPGLNELDQQLKSARDRLKSLEAGIPPEGFEDDYSAEEIAEDIEIEKNNIEAIEEEIAIKKAEPLEGEIIREEKETRPLFEESRIPELEEYLVRQEKFLKLLQRQTPDTDLYPTEKEYNKQLEEIDKEIEEQKQHIKDTQRDIEEHKKIVKEDTPTVDAAVSTEPETTNAYQDPEAKVIDEKKTAGKRKYVFFGKEHLPGIDYKRIIKKLNLRGRDTAEVHVEFAYVPNLDDKFTILIADEFIAGSKGKFGMAKERLLHGNYRIVINLARFDETGITEVIGEQATRLGISPEELMEKIGKEKLQEYAIRSVLQHEITHVNHFAWERAILDRTGTNFSEKELGKFRRELYKAYRKEMIDFMRKDENAFLRLGLSTLSIEGKPVIIESNEEAIEFLDMLMRDAAKPAATSSERLEASKRVWNMFSELLAYQSDSMNTETWVTKFKRVVKMILAKVGINVGKNDLNDLVDNLYSTGAVRENLTATKILRGEKAVLSEEEKLTARAREIKAKMEAPRGESAIVNPDKFKYANEILRNNNVSEDVIKDITKTLSTEERIAPVSDLMIPLESVFSLKYPAKDLQQRLKHLAKTNLEEYLNLVSFTETAERLYNLDIEEYTGREDINTGNAIHDLEEQIVGILGPVEIEEDAGPEYSDESTWLNAWSEPKKKGLPKKRTIEEAFGDAVNNQTGVNPDNEQQYNETGAAYTSPSSQEQTKADDAAQQEYTGSDETSRPKARERTTLRSLWGFLYSQAAQTVRRHSGASKTAGVVADTVLRAPHHKLREKETKSGRDYVQKKSMALGEFRFEIQQQIDALTNRGGVISRKINQQLTDFFSRGIIPENGKVAEAAEKLKVAVEKIYAWSDKTGKKHTEDFSLRPLDGGVFPRVFDVDKVASPEGRRKLMDLLNGIGIVDDAANEKYDATDAYNIILSSGGFVSGDFTIKARLDGESSIKSQQELFEKIEREISREQLEDLLLNDYQAIIPRFIDKAIEKTVYAELFGHRNENLNKLKRDIRKEVAEHNRKNAGTTLINVEDIIKDIDELMDIINHRYKVNTIPTRGRKVLQSAMNATTMASLTLVSLASMPEFLTATALGTKNPAKFATNILGASTFAVLRGLNGMHKLLTGKAMKGYFNPKTRMGKRAAMLRQLGLYDLANLGEAAAQRYVGPSFIKAGVGSTGNSFPIKALYRLYGLGNLEKGRFRARQVRAMLNMDVYFEVTALTTMTQMQQLMALTNLNQNIVADAKALSKAKRGKGFKLDSTVAQIKSNLKYLGLSNSEINELVRWYDAGHRQIHDVPPEFKLDLAGPAHRFVQSVVTLPSEGSLPKVFRDPRFAPFLLFKSFITTFANTFINTIAQRVRFAEGKGVSKKYQQSKQIAGMFGTAAAMYGAVQFAQAIAYLIKYGEDEDPWEEKAPDWAKFIQDFERTGLMGPLGSVAVQIGTPNYWSWQGKDPYDDMLDYIIGPMGKQFRNIGKAGADVAQGKELDLEGRLARAIPLTKSKPIREALGADPYYTKDKKGKLIRKRTLEKREEKKAATKEAKRQKLLDSITNDAAKRIKLSKDQIVDMDRRELDKHMRTKLGFNPDGRKSKASMINQYLKSQGADQSSFLKSEESESYKRKHEALQKVRESAKERYKGMTADERRKEYLSTNSMSKKEFDEYVEVEFGILLDGRKSRDDMNKQFHEVTKGWLKN